MNEQSMAKQVSSTVAAVILWLVTLVLGIIALNNRTIVYLIILRLGGNAVTVSKLDAWLVLLLGVVFLVFIIATAEYHRNRIGKPESWRLFGVTIAVELSVLILHYLLTGTLFS